jgi:hypothetical protein
MCKRSTPPIGETANDGHNFLYTDVAQWEQDVFAFLDENVALASGQSPQSIAPQILDVPSGKLHLKAYFWKPAGPGLFPAVLFNHGSGAQDAQHTAGQTMAGAAAILAPIYLKPYPRTRHPFCKTSSRTKKRPTERKLASTCTSFWSPPSNSMTPPQPYQS